MNKGLFLVLLLAACGTSSPEQTPSEQTASTPPLDTGKAEAPPQAQVSAPVTIPAPATETPPDVESRALEVSYSYASIVPNRISAGPQATAEILTDFELIVPVTGTYFPGALRWQHQGCFNRRDINPRSEDNAIFEVISPWQKKGLELKTQERIRLLAGVKYTLRVLILNPGHCDRIKLEFSFLSWESIMADKSRAPSEPQEPVHYVLNPVLSVAHLANDAPLGSCLLAALEKQGGSLFGQPENLQKGLGLDTLGPRRTTALLPFVSVLSGAHRNFRRAYILEIQTVPDAVWSLARDGSYLAPAVLSRARVRALDTHVLAFDLNLESCARELAERP